MPGPAIRPVRDAVVPEFLAHYLGLPQVRARLRDALGPLLITGRLAPP
ncbi:hypothetical protein ACIBCR_03065 [Micromonospora echinospora]